MKILLIQPYFYDFYRTYIRNQPLGLMYIKSYLKKHNYNCEIFDFLNTKHKKTIKIPKSISYLSKYYIKDKSPARLYDNYYRFGYSIEKFLKYISQRDFNIFAISTLFTGYLDAVIELIKIIKKYKLQSIIVTGGSAINKYLLSNNKELQNLIDYHIKGEGEYSFKLLLDYLIKQKGKIEDIPNLIYKNNEHLLETNFMRIDSLNNIPFPDRTHLDFNLYKIKNKKFMSLIASRGCPYKCKFCSIHQVWGNEYKKRNIDDILNEIKTSNKQYNIEFFNFEDDNLSYDKKWFNNLLDALYYEFKDKNFTFSAMNGLNYHTLNKTQIELMYKIGFTNLNFSIGTTSHFLIKKWQRPAGLEKLKNHFDIIKKLKIRTTVYFIIGSPDQTIQDVVNTILYLYKQPVLLGPSIYYITPEQPLIENIDLYKKADFIFYRSSSVYQINKIFTIRDKITLLKLSRFINVLKNKELWVKNTLYKEWIEKTIKNKKLYLITPQGEIVEQKNLNNIIIKQFFDNI